MELNPFKKIQRGEDFDAVYQFIMERCPNLK